MTEADRVAAQVRSLRPRLKAAGLTAPVIAALMCDLAPGERAQLVAQLALCVRPWHRRKSGARK
jgi:hypothetical protein